MYSVADDQYEYRTQVVAGESGPGTPFVAAAGAHPSFLTPEDASKIKIPFCILPSMNEDQEACKGFEANLKVEKHIETFADMPHGWMAARQVHIPVYRRLTARC